MVLIIFLVVQNFNANNFEMFEENDEEAKAYQQRKIENEERQKAIRSRIELEMKMKSELRSKAQDFIESVNA